MCYTEVASSADHNFYFHVSSVNTSFLAQRSTVFPIRVAERSEPSCITKWSNLK